MARGWRVLDATAFEGVVGGARGRIVLIGPDGTTADIPAEEAAVLLIGNKAAVNAAALHYLTKHDIVVLATDWRGVPFAGLYPWSNHGRVAARHLAQAGLTRPRKKNAWMQLVRAKVAGQAATLTTVDPHGGRHLADLAKSVRSGDPANVEATAARFYWQHLFWSVDGFVRDQDAGDNFNALLNYGYTVLRGYGIRAAAAAGLSPPLGLFHRGRANYFNLVDDLIEPFRPAIDHAVVQLECAATLEDSQVKTALVSAASQAFTTDGQRIPTVLEDLAQQLGRYVEGEVDRFNVVAWTGPQAENVATSSTGLNDDSASCSSPTW